MEDEDKSVRNTVVHPPPRTWLKHPDATPDHWRKPEPDWKTARTARDRALLAAAKDQHRVTFYLRRFRDDSLLNNPDIAMFTKRHPDTVSAILRGAAHVSMADLHLIAAAVNAHIDTHPNKGRAKNSPGQRRTKR